MPLIPEALIDDVQTRVDIADVIGRYIPLKRAGRHFKASCPFHQERTPSFMVNTDRQIFHCFGCGVGGNVFSFLMRHDRLTFPEAVRQLAEHVGVHVPEGEPSDSAQSSERLFALMEKACGYFERLLISPQGRAARAYLERRGVSERTRRAFRVGFAPPGWRGLVAAAASKGITPEQLETVGLAIKGPSGSYARFRHRLIFPILDVRGRVVGFGGRSLDGQEPKYLNSPETPIYSKGRHLFGLAQAKEAIIKARTVIVVEGYFDCVVLADAGIAHVVSPQGTALTDEQVRWLKRYAEHVILAFDADAAGEAATLRGIDLLVEAGLQVAVAQLPPGVDPDEYLRASGRERFEQLLHHSVGICEFLIETACRRYPIEETEGKVAAAQFVLPTIARVPDAMLRSEYIRRLAERFQLDEGAVAQELAKATPHPSNRIRGYLGTGAPAVRRTTLRVGPTVAKPAGLRGPEWVLAALIVDEPTRWTQVEGRLSLDDITDPVLRRVLALVCELHAAGRETTPAQMISRVSEEGREALVAELVAFAQSIAAKEEALRECIRRLHTASRKRQLSQLQQQLQLAQAAADDAQVQRLLAEYQEMIHAS